MRAGRKNLKRAGEEITALQEGQSIMEVVSSLRGSNIIEVIDAKGEKSLALVPARFQKSMWVKRGSFVVVDESGREEATKSDSKVACIVSQVLFYEQVRQLQKSQQWPEEFKSSSSNSWNRGVEEAALEREGNDGSSSEDGGLPAIETNTNRMRPVDLHSNSDSDSESDS